ncbi:dienelactone hydrolase family protein [Kribbella swartbergensis]
MRPSALGGYDDWPGFVRDASPLTGDELTTRVAGLLGVPEPGDPPLVRIVDEWQSDDVRGSVLEWNTPFGPPTRAWLVRPRDGDQRPGLLGLHCHAGVKSVGAERLVETPEPSAGATRLREDLYEGRAVANHLARAGFVVLCHDTFAWGSRRFQLDPLPWRLRDVMATYEAAWLAADHSPIDDEWYDVAAGHHENTIAKAAGLLGTSFAGMVAYDDLVALSVLRALEGVDRDRIGVFGFSGGGGRSATLTALDPGIKASAIVCMMTTFDSLVPAYLDAHSWLFTTPGLARHLDHPSLTAGRARHHQLVVYAQDDELFPPQGMLAADRELTEHFHYGPGTYTALFLPGPHRFDTEMQQAAENFFAHRLAVE